MKGNFQKYMLRIIISDENQSGFGISKEIMREKFTSTKFVVIFFQKEITILLYTIKEHGKSWRKEREGGEWCKYILI